MSSTQSRLGQAAFVAAESRRHRPDRLREKVTALSIAANGKFSEMAAWLMDNGAPVKDRKQIELVNAARRGDALEINRVLAEGAKADQGPAAGEEAAGKKPEGDVIDADFTEKKG